MVRKNQRLKAKTNQVKIWRPSRRTEDEPDESDQELSRRQVFERVYLMALEADLSGNPNPNPNPGPRRRASCHPNEPATDKEHSQDLINKMYEMDLVYPRERSVTCRSLKGHFESPLIGSRG